MHEITFKVAKRGEGKTRWLLNIANEYSESDRPILYCTDLESEYGNFCEKYFKTFHKIANIQRISLTQLTGNEVVLIDDLMAMNFTIKDIAYIQRNCYKLYITVEGTTEDHIEENPNQLTIFDNMT